MAKTFKDELVDILNIGTYIKILFLITDNVTVTVCSLKTDWLWFAVECHHVNHLSFSSVYYYTRTNSQAVFTISAGFVHGRRQIVKTLAGSITIFQNALPKAGLGLVYLIVCKAAVAGSVLYTWCFTNLTYQEPKNKSFLIIVAGSKLHVTHDYSKWFYIMI